MRKYVSITDQPTSFSEHRGTGSDDSESEDELFDELTSYLSNDDKDKDALAYWTAKSKRFPILSKIAFRIYSIPASTAEVERFFSKLRLVVDEYRFNLNEETTSMLMLGKYCPDI
jgi:hypothetical protein